MRGINNKKGFTLIELLVVISIIGFLSTLAVVSLKNAREKARDTRRKADLTQISKALQFYYDNRSTYQVANSGSGGTGTGWFSYNYTGYDSVAKELNDLGYIGSVVRDPSGLDAGYNGTGAAYMIYADANHFTLWTSLERPSSVDIATQNTCYFSSYDSYHSSYPADRRMNYCVSY